MQYPPLIRVEQQIHIGVNTGKRNFYTSVYTWSAQNCSKLMSRVADFRLNIHSTDLMERYETFLWTQIIQFSQLVAECVSIFLKSIESSGEIPLRTPRLLLSVDPIRRIDILNARY
jgi:hypothetical protein